MVTSTLLVFCLIVPSLFPIVSGRLYKRMDEYALQIYYHSETCSNTVICAATCSKDTFCNIVSYETVTNTCYHGNDVNSQDVITPSVGSVLYLLGPCDVGWTLVGSRCLLFVATRFAWVDSQANCQSLGGNLAHVYSLDDLDDITATIPCKWAASGCFPWLAMNDILLEGIFTSVSGQNVPTKVALVLMADNYSEDDCSYYSTNFKELRMFDCSSLESSFCEKKTL